MREVSFSDKDRPLRHDVSELGAIVGAVLREQCGEALFAAVEEARTSAIRRRGGEAGADDDLARAVATLDPERAEELVRGFATYFQVVNLAEQIHNGLTLIHPEFTAQKIHCLNTVGAFINRRNPAVPQQLFNRVFFDIPVSAVYLNCQVANIQGPVTDIPLCDRYQQINKTA